MNLQQLMRLNGAEPRNPVSVFSLLGSLAFQRISALHNVAFFESFDSVELFSRIFPGSSWVRVSSVQFRFSRSKIKMTTVTVNEPLSFKCTRVWSPLTRYMEHCAPPQL